MTLNVVLLLAVVLVPGQADSPITTVVNLIKEMQAKLESDRKSAQKTYDKFACWCEKTLERKAAAIDEAKKTIEITQRDIIELKGQLGELGATIRQLEKELGENE